MSCSRSEHPGGAPDQDSHHIQEQVHGGTPYELFEPLWLSRAEVLRGANGFDTGALALGGSITAGFFVLLGATLASFFFQISGLQLAISAGFVLFSS